MTPPRTPTRARLIRAARDLFQSRGYHGVGLTEILARAKAPKGSLYHHFAGGKPALASAAIADLAEQMSAYFQKARDQGLGADRLVAGLFSQTADWIEANGFATGALLSVMAQEVVPGDAELTKCLGRAYEKVIAAFDAALAAGGADGRMAGPVLALLDGAIAQARAAQSRTPIQAAQAAAQALLE